MNIKNILELAFRGYISCFLILYGTGKIMGNQFYLKDKLPEKVANTTLAEASGFDLAWTFMGYSYEYILFIGISQIIESVLLWFNRTKLLGVAVLLPIMLNIVVFDILFLDKLGALMSALIYTTMLVGILVINKDAVLRAISKLVTTSAGQNSFKKRAVNFGVALAICLVLFIADQYLVNLFGHGDG